MKTGQIIGSLDKEILNQLYKITDVYGNSIDIGEINVNCSGIWVQIETPKLDDPILNKYIELIYEE